MGRFRRCQSKASSGTRTRHPHGVPARLANHRIENRRRDLFHKLPIVAEGFRDRVQTARQDTPFTQEDTLPLQGCARFITFGSRRPGASVEVAAGVAPVPAIVCSPE